MIMESAVATSLDVKIGRRIKRERLAQGVTLDALAARSGVSRAMISRVERGEASASATLLARICAGLGISLASLFAEAAAGGGPLARFADQPVWRDPETGYLRRNVSPPGTGSPVEIVDVTFPPGERVTFDNGWTTRSLDQHVWVLAGRLEMIVDGVTYALAVGDCLHMRLGAPVAFHNPTDQPVRYAVVLTAAGPLPRNEA